MRLRSSIQGFPGFSATGSTWIDFAIGAFGPRFPVGDLKDYGKCKSCGSPLIKGRPYKVVKGKDHPWGLTQWACNLVCSKVHKSFKGALECYFHDVDWKAELKKAEDSPFYKAVAKEKEWKGSSFTVPFKLPFK